MNRFSYIFALFVAGILLLSSCLSDVDDVNKEKIPENGIALSFAIYNGNKAGEAPKAQVTRALTVNTGTEDNLNQVRVIAFEKETGKQVFNQRFDGLNVAGSKIYIVLPPEHYNKPLDFFFLGNEKSLPLESLNALQLSNTTTNEAAFLAKRTNITHPLSQDDLVDQGYPLFAGGSAVADGRPTIDFPDQGFKLFAHRQLYGATGAPSYQFPRSPGNQTAYPLPYSAVYPNITITAQTTTFPVTPVALLHTSARVRVTINAAEANAKGIMVVGFRLVGVPKMMHLFYQGHTETATVNPAAVPANYTQAMNPLDFFAKVSMLTKATAAEIENVDRTVLHAYNDRVPLTDFYGLLKVPYNSTYYKILDNGKKPIDLYIPEMIFNNAHVPEKDRVRLELILMKDGGAPFVYAIEMTAGDKYTGFISGHTENSTNIAAYNAGTLKPVYVALYDRKLFDPANSTSIYGKKAAVGTEQRHYINLVSTNADTRAEQFRTATNPVQIDGKNYDLFNQAGMTGNTDYSHFSLFRNTKYNLNIVVKDLNTVETTTTIEPWNKVTLPVADNTYGSGYRIEAVNSDFATGNTATFTVVPVGIEEVNAQINYTFEPKCSQMSVTGDKTGTLTTNAARGTITVTKPTCFPAGGTYLAIKIGADEVATYTVPQSGLDPCPPAGPSLDPSTGTITDPDLGTVVIGPENTDFSGLTFGGMQWHTAVSSSYGLGVNGKYEGQSAYLPKIGSKPYEKYINTPEGAPKQGMTGGFCTGKQINGAPARMMTKADLAIIQKYYQSLGTPEKKEDFATKFQFYTKSYYMLFDDWGIAKPFIEGSLPNDSNWYQLYVITHLFDTSLIGQEYDTGVACLPRRTYTETFQAFSTALDTGYLNFYSRYVRCVKDVPNK